MVDILSLYLDDSGTRHPDKKIGRVPEHGYDYFSLGGILVDEDGEDLSRHLHKEFCDKWSIDYPLHSAEIRARSKRFTWLNELPKLEMDEFYEDLYCLMKTVPVTGIACVIDRPGYNERYRKKYGRDRWSLCRTAFGIVTERACKYAISKNLKLRILPERSTKTDDLFIKEYYSDLKSNGHPFNNENSSKYCPLTGEEFSGILYDLKFKYKSSPMAQIADLYLWPICMGGYHKSNRPYMRLLEDKKLIDCYLDDTELDELGIKYSCFESIKVKP